MLVKQSEKRPFLNCYEKQTPARLLGLRIPEITFPGHFNLKKFFGKGCPAPLKRGLHCSAYISKDVYFYKDHRDEIEVPDPLAVEDLKIK